MYLLLGWDVPAAGRQGDQAEICSISSDFVWWNSQFIAKNIDWGDGKEVDRSQTLNDPFIVVTMATKVQKS